MQDRKSKYKEHSKHILEKTRLSKKLIFSAQLEAAELTLCHHGRRSIS